MRLQGKVALITGGGGTIGGAQARLFAQEGAAVAVADLFPEKARAVAQEIVARGGRAMALKLEVRSAAEWQAAMAATEQAFGPIERLADDALRHVVQDIAIIGRVVFGQSGHAEIPVAWQRVAISVRRTSGIL